MGMVIKSSIRQSEYHDSVALMEVARALAQRDGVSDAAVVMATEANKSILRQAGLFAPAIETATPNDLVIVVSAATEETAAAALQAAGEQLGRRQEGAASAEFQPRTLRGAVRSYPAANLALISVAGQYAVTEAWAALHQGLHVLLFSDNVPLADEVALKRYALQHGLLMMGADCGTAIINGVALGFANSLPRGPVGIVAASGTGLQEVSTLLAKLGVGISQGIGTGGRDLKEEVGGLMMLAGLDALRADPETEVLVLISKPPAPAVAARVLERAAAATKPTVVCFLGGDPAPVTAAGCIPARTLQETAYLAAAQVTGYNGPLVDELLAQEADALRRQADRLRARLQPRQKYLRGLFSGGTLAAEALLIWQEMVGDVFSNITADPRLRLADPARSQAHSIVDLGADEFTVGRPHPMLDNDLRIRRLLQEAADPQVAVIVLDVVLGYGAHPNPASELGPAIRQALRRAGDDGRELVVIASLTGTEGDPQGLSRQAQTLRESGAVVASCNGAAARLAGLLVAWQ